VKLTAGPDKTEYKAGEVIIITATIEGVMPPVDGYFVVRGMGMEWRTNPIRWLTPPYTAQIPIVVPYCYVSEGVTVSGYPIKCPTNKVPQVGNVTFTVEFVGLDGSVLARDTFTVTIYQEGVKPETLTTPATTTRTQSETTGEAKLPLWLLLGGAVLLWCGMKG